MTKATPPEQEHKALAWLWSIATRFPGLWEQFPLEILSDDGRQWLSSMREFPTTELDTNPTSEQEGRAYFRVRLLAHISKEAAKAQQNGSLEHMYHAIDMLDLFTSALEPSPVIAYDVAIPQVRSVIPTGIEPIDKQIRGLSVGELGIIFLPPGRGKTQMLINFADTALLCEKDVLYITVADQSQDELIPRIDTCILGTPCPPEATPEILAERHTQATQQRTGRLWVADYTDRICSITDVERTIQQCASDLIIVDHADDVLSPYASDPTATRHSLRVVYLALKKLAVRYDVPIWTASQSPEISWNFKVTSISDMAEAKVGKATGAAIILGFSGGSIPEQVPGIMYCSIAKARRWYTERNFPLHFDFETCRVW